MGRVQFIFTLFLTMLLGMVEGRAYGQLAPLQHQEVVHGLPAPTSMAFLPDGRALVTSLNGRVWITSSLDQLPVTYELWMSLDTMVNNSAEHGLLEIMLDPDFSNNNFVYLYWSTRQNKNRLSRFVHLADTSSLSTETVIYETPDPFNLCCHVGGASTFLNDGTIVIAIGDDFAPLLAQDMASPYGKVHRINADGSVPADNPFYDNTAGIYNANGSLKTIYASGIRNPFRGAHDPVTDRFLIGEVGSNDHTTAWEDTHELSSGANFGWPFCGPGGRDLIGNCTDPSYDDPVLTYSHEGVEASVTAGCFYRNGAWPSQWEGRYFYGDYVRGWINYVEFDAAGNVLAEVPVIDESVYPGLTAEYVVKMLVGPDGDLYYVRLQNDSVSPGSINRLLINPNQVPVCDSIWATPTFGAGPNMLVEFGGSVTDPEGAPLTYSWIFGDGTPNDSTLSTMHTYANFGAYQADLIVNDGVHDHSCGQIDINVGQAPTVMITSPADNSGFQAGDVITFESFFSDNGPMTVADLEWVVVFNHDTHTHPQTGGTGVGTFDLIVPTTGHDFTGNTWYTITLIGTDADGLQASHSIQIFPEKRNVSILSTPPGLEIMLDGIPYITPYSQDHAIGTQLAVSVPNNQQCLAGTGYQFQQWDAGQPGIFLYDVPAGPSTIIAEFVNDGACNHCGTAVDFDGIDDFISVDSLVLSDDMTIEFWLDLDPVISARDIILGDGDNFSIEMASGGRLRIFDNGVKAQSSIAMGPNQWNHYALVRTNGEWSIFINGVLDVNATSVTNHTQDLLITSIGKSFRPEGLDGALDELRIWSGARTIGQINQYMGIHVPGFLPNVMDLYWRFDQPPGSQNIADLSGNGFNGIAGVDNTPGIDESTFFEANGPMVLACEREVNVAVRARLDGPSDEGQLLMNDGARAAGYVPFSEPYSSLGFSLSGGGETTTPGVLAVTGANAVVDWILIELRDPNNPSVVLHTRAGLLLRNGDIVDVDGVSPVDFTVERPSFNIALRHRNHLGIMAEVPIEMGEAGTTTTIDMQDPNVIMFGQEARKLLNGNTIAAMWAGNTTGDQFVKYAGFGNDRDPILVGIGGVVPTAIVLGYSVLDVNLDGVIKYAGPENDRDLILVNIGGIVATMVRVEQLP